MKGEIEREGEREEGFWQGGDGGMKGERERGGFLAGAMDG